jgi:hypothetical protein
MFIVRTSVISVVKLYKRHRIDRDILGTIGGQPFDVLVF